MFTKKQNNLTQGQNFLHSRQENLVNKRNELNELNTFYFIEYLVVY